MKRRSFVKASLLTAPLGALMPGASLASVTDEQQKNKSPEFYELRVYTLKNDTQQKIVENYFKDAAIPAYNRYGSQPVGVFTELKPAGQTKLYVVIPFTSLADYAKIQDKLLKDPTYNEMGKAYLNAPASEPAYERIESSLLQAFPHMPVMEVPEKKSRIFELRRYESSGENAGKKKIEMFDTVGEIEIFKRVGLNPVFFGETIIGGLRPNLTYLLSFDDMEMHDKNWKQFVGDPEWKRIKATPGFADADIVSRITNVFLAPTAFSQV